MKKTHAQRRRKSKKGRERGREKEAKKGTEIERDRQNYGERERKNFIASVSDPRWMFEQVCKKFFFCCAKKFQFKIFSCH